jgi:hypothetical protein
MVGLLVTVFGAGAGTAFADPPRPTDYRSEVVSVTPKTDAIEVRVVGGDSFLELTAEAGVEVVVEGYEGEPYLRILADGGVEENQYSPARWLNDNRYGTTKVPPEADADAAPVWRRVGSGHRWAWHDHRTHWMSSVPPLGLHPGDQVLDEVVPLQVNGRDVEVGVVSTWVGEPSKLPWVLSSVAALVLTVAIALAGGRRPLAWLALALSALALLVGGWQTLSLPSVVGPPPTAWALPATALVASIAAVVTEAVGRWSVFTRRALVVVAAAQLCVWLFVRRAVLTHPVLPTSAPFWFDRAATAAVGVSACVLVAAAVWRLSPRDAPA